MPNIQIQTNVAVEIQTAKEMKARLGKAIETIPGKSEQWLMVEIIDKVNMCFQGKDDPCALAHVELFGSASEAVYDKMTAVLTDILKDALAVAPNRVYVKYTEYPRWGWNGSNL